MLLDPFPFPSHLATLVLLVPFAIPALNVSYPCINKRRVGSASPSSVRSEPLYSTVGVALLPFFVNIG